MIKQISRDINRQLLENIIPIAKDTTFLLVSLIMGVGPTASLSIMSMQCSETKLITILVIFCRSAHQNNSNYLPFFVALYLYFASVKNDTITLLNYLGLSILYNVLQKKLKAVTSLGMTWIKQQNTNRRLVGMWDNFKY